MAIITKPAQLLRNEDNAFEINDSDMVSLLTALNAPAQFLSPENWKRVRISFTSTVKNQRRTIRLAHRGGLTLTGNLIPSNLADNNFQVHQITIVDLEHTPFTINRSDLPTADIDFSVEPLTNAPSGSFKVLQPLIDALNAQAPAPEYFIDEVVLVTTDGEGLTHGQNGELGNFNYYDSYIKVAGVTRKLHSGSIYVNGFGYVQNGFLVQPAGGGTNYGVNFQIEGVPWIFSLNCLYGQQTKVLFATATVPQYEAVALDGKVATVVS